LNGRSRVTARAPLGPGRGFTLAEVAVTIVIVGVALVYVLQSLSASKFTAANTRNLKLAKELATYTLGQIECGRYWEETGAGRFEGSYADEGYPDFRFEVVLGQESFRDEYRDTSDDRFDNWRYNEDYSQSEDEEEEVEQPYEQVQIRVSFPTIKSEEYTLTLEKWIAWNQVYEPEEAEPGAAPEQ
jgi:prepilin-type N-terminal cleavage/methylation domain-containing protein